MEKNNMHTSNSWQMCDLRFYYTLLPSDQQRKKLHFSRTYLWHTHTLMLVILILQTIRPHRLLLIRTKQNMYIIQQYAYNSMSYNQCCYKGAYDDGLSCFFLRLLDPACWASVLKMWTHRGLSRTHRASWNTH